jgi:hypothetical protein
MQRVFLFHVKQFEAVGDRKTLLLAAYSDQRNIGKIVNDGIWHSLFKGILLLPFGIGLYRVPEHRLCNDFLDVCRTLWFFLFDTCAEN